MPMMEDRYLEYFVCSNPPLLPHGVEEVVAAAKQKLSHLFEGDFVEIIYEPEVAWFKCTSFSTHRDQITEVLQILLHQIVYDETELKDCDQGSNEKTEADIEVVASNPRVIPWAAYCESNIFQNQNFLYPEHLVKYSHKAVWRGLDELPEYNVDALLSVAVYFWNVVAISSLSGQIAFDLDKFGKLMGCEASPNLSQSVIYVAGENAKAIDRATRGLDNMVKAMSLLLNPEHVRHLVVAEDYGHGKLAYRYLSHVGLDKKTLISPTDPDGASEYSILHNHAAILRTVNENHDGVWVVDGTTYSGALLPKPDTSKSFAVFEDYRFKPRTASPRKLPVSGGHTTPTRHSVETSQAVIPSSSHSTSSQKVTEWVDGLCKNENDDLISFSEDIMPIRAPPGLPAIIGTMPILTPTSPSTPGPPEALDSIWIQSQPAATQSQAQPTQPSQSMLDSFFQADLIPELNEAMPQFSKSGLNSGIQGGLISWWDALEPERPLSQALQPSGQENETLEFNHGVVQAKEPLTGRQLDKAEELLLDLPVVFGVEESTPKELRTTMNQKSGRKQTITKTKTSTHKHKSGLLKKLEVESEKLVKNLQWAPGRISLQLKFGRLYFRNLLESQINLGTGPQWDTLELQRSLNKKPDIIDGERRVGFQSILSTSGEDGDTMVRTEIDGQVPWGKEPLETSVFFCFTCNFEGAGAKLPFLIKVDADSMEYSCQGLDEEISSISIHCARRAWDMKLCAERSRVNGLPAECKEFAQSLSESLKVSVLTSGEITLEVPEVPSIGMSIKKIEIKYTARYGTELTSSILNITMTRPIKKIMEAGETSSIFRGTSNFAAIKRRNPKGGPPHQWIEASISSAMAEENFKENMTLGFAESSSWTPEELKAAGAFEDICRPGLAMITHMDGIGAANDNGRGPKDQSLAEVPPRPRAGGAQPKFEYW